MKVELHCHSYYSKGTKLPWEGIPSPADIIKRAKAIGLDAIAITDHNKIDAWKEASREAKRQGIIFIPGEEVSTADGHLLALGISEYIEQGKSAEETMDIIREQGGIAVAPHPYDIKGDGMRDKALKADAIEVFNALNLDTLSNRLASIKARKHGMSMVAGSDAHTLNMLGHGMTIAKNAEDMDTLLRAIKRGKTEIAGTYISVDKILYWSKQRFMLSYHDVIEYINANYSLPKAKISLAMLNKFLASRSMLAWKMLADFALAVGRFYSVLNFVRYY